MTLLAGLVSPEVLMPNLEKHLWERQGAMAGNMGTEETQQLAW